MDAPKSTFKPDLRFWLVFAALSVTSLLAALEEIFKSTALPTIVADLRVGDNYPWVSNAYFLTTYVEYLACLLLMSIPAHELVLLHSASFQPLYGQLSNIFGRRYPMIFSVVLFILGSGICGGASSAVMLIAGRAVQGVGEGGINVLIELIVCDLVPLTQRGSYIGLMFVFFALGTSLGPCIGGAIVKNTTWRWVFYLNLPIGGLGLVLLILFLQVNYNREMSVGRS